MALDDTLMNDTPIFNDRAIEDGFYAYWGKRPHDPNYMEPAHRAYCKRAYEDAKEIADLKAKLAEVEREAQATYDQAAAQYQRANEAEARVEETCSFIERIAWEGTEYRRGEPVSACILCCQTQTEGHVEGCEMAKILATPDTGAAAVLATADRVYDTEQAFADRGNLEDEKGMAGNKRYHEWPEMTDHIRAQTELLEAVADWRKKRQGKTK